MKTLRTCGIFWLLLSSTRAFAAGAAAVSTGTGGIGVLDWIVIAAYFASMLGIGWFYSRQTKTTEDFFLGGRDMGAWMVGLSLFATVLSTASYIAFPGEAIRHGPMVVIGTILQHPANPLGGRLVSDSEVHEAPCDQRQRAAGNPIRLGHSSAGDLFFLVLRFLWMAMIIHITVKAVVVPVLGLDASWMPGASLAIPTGKSKAAVK